MFASSPEAFDRRSSYSFSARCQPSPALSRPPSYSPYPSTNTGYQRNAYRQPASSIPQLARTFATPQKGQSRANLPCHSGLQGSQQSISQSRQTLAPPPQFGDKFKTPLTDRPADAGLQTLSVPIRRVRGLATALNKLDHLSYVFETVGTILESDDAPPVLGGITFLLEELASRQRGVQLKCQYTDVDGIRPEVYFGQVYR